MPSAHSIACVCAWSRAREYEKQKPRLLLALDAHEELNTTE